MEKEQLFKWKYFEPEIILLTVRWYLRYRNLVEMMEEWGLLMAHTTIIHWVHQYVPELDIGIRPHLKPTNDSWRVDKTCIKEKGQCICIVQLILKGIILKFHLSKISDKQAEKFFFKKAWLCSRVFETCVITVYKNPVYPKAIEQLKK